MTTRKPAPHKMATGLPELLAPAGSPESFRAAVAAGADAVYLSGKRFGARKYAANFSDTEIGEAIQYAHSWGVRVYITVNTLLHDRELKGALEYLGWLYSIGADAILVQDTGLLALARECMPGLPLHASTQMTIHNTPGVRWAAAQGLSRVVLARELSLQEVERIARDTRDTGVGLEVFVHGALCYSYSGQCLLSSVIGGRSGNRGMCAQPCRKPYTLVTGDRDAEGRPVYLKEVPLQDRYLLSPKDLCTYYHLPELVRSPVESLKIEGRMKSPEYVAIVTSTYRRALDAIAAGTWKPSDEEYRNLLLAFNRGFTAGYIFSERYENLMSRDAPDNRGLFVGTIDRFNPGTRKAEIRATSSVIPVTGDGILITGSGMEREVGFSLNTLPERTGAGFTLQLPAPVLKGASVYITASRNLATAARRIVAKPPLELRRPVPLDLKVVISPGGEITCEGSLNRPDGITVPVGTIAGGRMETAQNHPLTAEQLRQQLRKTGDSAFTIRALSLRYGGGLFSPASVLNAARRKFLNEAAARLKASYIPDPICVRTAGEKLKETLHENDTGKEAAKNNAGKNDPPLRIMVYTDSIGGVREASAAGAGIVCFEPDFPYSCGRTCGTSPLDPVQSQILAALEICREYGCDLVWKFPRIAHDRELDQLLPALGPLYGQGLRACMSGNPGIAQAIRDTIPGFVLYGDESLNIFNHAALVAAHHQYAVITLSPELSRDEIQRLVRISQRGGIRIRSAMVVYGNIETMVTRDCLARLVIPCGSRVQDAISRPLLWLKDVEGRLFPVTMDETCRTHIGSPAGISRIDNLPDLAATGITDIIIDARHQSTSRMQTLVRHYKTNLNTDYCQEMREETSGI